MITKEFSLSRVLDVFLLPLELLNFTMTTMSEANAKFATDLFHRLAEEHPCDNILFSPVNATSALGLLALASGCEQAADIEKVGVLKHQGQSLQTQLIGK